MVRLLQFRVVVRVAEWMGEWVCDVDVETTCARGYSSVPGTGTDSKIK